MKALGYSLTAFRKAAAPALITLCVALSMGASWYQSGKIVICHVPPGNPNNRHTIEVSQNALQAHLDHGDYIGSCNELPPPAPQDSIPVKEEGVAYP